MDDLGRELAAVFPDAEVGLLAGLDPDGIALGDPEPEEERVAPDERRQDGPGLDILAGLHGPGLDDARDGGPDERVVKVELGLVEGRARLGDLGGRGQDLGPPGFDLFARDEPGVLGDDAFAPLQPGLGIGLPGLGLLERGLGRFDGQPVALGLDLDEDLPGRGELALAEEDAVHGPGHPGRDLDLLEGFDGADGRDRINEVLGLDLLHVDGELHPPLCFFGGG